MSAIYLRHPQHGEKVATSEGEATYDQGNGWVRFTPGLPVAAPEIEPAPEIEFPAQSGAPAKRPYTRRKKG